MMRKCIVLLLVVVLLAPMGVRTAQAADTKSTSIGIPTTTGLMGSNNSTKSFILDLPSGVSASAITTNSLKYNGNNEVVGLVVQNGKVKVTLNGNKSSKTFEVKGYKKEFENPFITNVGNSIWRYSDGRRWQINEYNEQRDTLVSYDLNAADSSTPSADPPKRMVSASSNQSTTGRIWYASKMETVDSQYVIDSTISIQPAGGSSYLIGGPRFKNGKIITTYTIGPAGAGVTSKWIDQTDEATIPVTGWVEGRFYYAFANYYYTATAKVTTYSYGGMVTFDYAPPSEPALTGNVFVLKPNPNPTKFANADVPVQLSLKGDLAAYTDTSNISEWVFYAKEKGLNSTLQTKKDYSKVLTSSRQFDFTIPKSRITSNNYRQEYDLTVSVRFSKPVVTKSGTITSLSESLGATIEVYKNQSSITFPEPTAQPTPVGKPPVAVIMAPGTAKAGEEFMMSGGGSYDPDGTIKSYLWDTPGIGDVVMGRNSTTWYPESSMGENTIGLTVVDNDGMTGSTGKFITVVKPVPEAKLEIQGTKKQNRKVTIHSSSTSPIHYPLNDDLTKITIIAISGGTSSDIKYSGSLNGVKDKDVLFKQPGTYKATIYVENTLGYSDTSSITFDIQPDKPPVVYFSMQGRVYRDPDNGNKAVITIEDMSYSPDADLISRRLWEYRYDSDNDGNFEDETWKVISDGNINRLNLEVVEVGKYEVKVTEFEQFGQPTIDEFVTDSDRKWADSSGQNIIKKIVDVKNRAPQGDWKW
ncbi:PKD domain-containing protein [Paenibacillus sp. BR2-3]|uniref:PKD domain-containing protein n=1 Tax=Paenibacillus sp. BR2-3 TaxID=3048494 RepID=UPI003977DFB8